MLSAGHGSDLERMAYDIFHCLNVRFEGGDMVAQATDLLSKMVKQDEVRIILDDLWRLLDLSVGILTGSCKMMIVSRFERVCLGIGCNLVFKLQGLREDDSSSSGSGNLDIPSMRPVRVPLHHKLPLRFEKLIQVRNLSLHHKLPLRFVKLKKVRNLRLHHKLPLRFEKLIRVRNLLALLVLNLRGSGIQALPLSLKYLTNLKLLNLTNCRNLQITYGLISSLVHLKELYMLGSFNDWEASGNASTNELEFLHNLTALQIQIRDPSIIPINSRIWSRLTTYVISAPEELKCRYVESSNVNFPADSYLPLEANCNNDVQSLFNDKVEFGSLNNLGISNLESVTSIWCHQSCPSLFTELKVLVVTSCNTLRYLISHSIAKVLVRLEQLTIEDCFMMQEVIADEAEAGIGQTNESLFPRLRKLKLLGLSMLKSFCHMMNDLELPSLEDLTLKGCQEMEEFSGGTLSMPALRCVEKDYSRYRIDGLNSVQYLFNDKLLFVHHLDPSLSRYQGQEAEDIMKEDCMGEPILSHPQRSSQASGGKGVENLLYDIEAKNFCSVSNQNIMTEDGDTYMSSYTTSDRDEIEKMNIEVLGNRRYLKDFTSFCLLLPVYYEFTKDILVWQWIVGGFIELDKDKMEEVCAECFDALVGMGYIVPSGYDHIFDQMKYKIGGEITTFLQKQMIEPKFGQYSDSERSYTTEVEHMSITFSDINRVKLGVLKQYSHLRTLVIHNCYGVDPLPSDLFCELESLKILNLSHANIAVLPSSFEKLKELRFFDMTKTPIRWLPETMRWFSHLQTLNLDGCSQLERLPKCMDKLANLRHLILDVRRLQLMPAGIGKLSNLETMNAFLVGEGDGSCVSELKELNKLRGSVCLMNLENVGSKEKALEACLDKKVGLRKIELHWSDFQDEMSPSEEEILESLQPPISIQELKILFYSGGVLPSWISNPSFNELVSIILHGCRYFSSLPSLGELPSLESLSIIENNKVMEIDSSFFRNPTNQDLVAFPKLKKLSLDSMSKLEKWTGLENGDFPSLRRLIIEYCPKFVELAFLSLLSSLSRLEIRYCPELSCMPEDGLPPSLESLMIKQSQKLKDQCCDKEWKDWSKIARVPIIYIDDQEFSPQNSK